ncbi:anti-sigma B factor antagonist [Microbacterium endophyticum]|uniref:Anti-sigma factor antagonist n=1 Tax=Microbacterium endophyticum TaxID=1526412 RepID=A0A7W4YNY3_9MICO|nr:STAS domain-containing protein [Microbacterium endophyticum]MBB2976181.1 anti-sigma B factor antagonist [Microbacterium endophyticum]NIK36478.1 anti-sigma B factor antagonist [Microbacterium endophyticum]
MTAFHTDDHGADVAIIRGTGRLNMVTAPELREAVSAAVGRGRAKVVVELSQITFMDSSGLGALIGALKTSREAGGDLRIAEPAEQVMMVLRLSNVDKILKPYEHAETAFSG